MMLKSETKRGEFGDIAIRAQSRAGARGVPSPRARVLYMAGCEFFPPTIVRTRALQSKQTGSLAAYGARNLTACPSRTDTDLGIYVP